MYVTPIKSRSDPLARQKPASSATRYIIGIFIFFLSLFIIVHFYASVHLHSHDSNANAAMEEVQLSRLRNKAAVLLHNLEEDKKKIAQIMNSVSSNNVNSNSMNDMSNAGGFAGHNILTMSDSEFYSTTIDVMMSSYGEASGDGTCSLDFGNTLVNNWRTKNQTYCHKASNLKPTSLGSSVECSLVHQTRHHGQGDNLCVMNKVSVNLGIFGDQKRTSDVVKHYVETKHNDQPYMRFPRGFVQADCEVDGKLWRDEFMPGWNAEWTTKAMETVPPDRAVECDEWVEHPVLVVQRDTFANFFHDSEDFVNVFLSLAILRWNIGDTQIYLTDLYPQGPFWEMWSKVFSSPKHQTLTAWDLRNIHGKDTNRRVCFKKLAINIYGPAAPITVASWNTPCSRTALVRAYSDYVIRGLNLQSLTHYMAAVPSKKVVVTWMARRASSEWPEKRFCDSKNSFFDCVLWDSFGIRSLGRMVQNDHELVTALKGLEKETYVNGAQVVFQDVDYNLLSFEEQIKVDLQTDVMVGPHGAGLLHNIFMRDRAVLVELSVDGSGGLRHFHNLAHWYGRRYVNLTPSNPVRVEALYKELAQIIAAIDISKY